MNVEETILFILETQARTSENLEQITEKQKKFEVNQTKFDKRLDAIGKLVQTGMKMMVQIQQVQREDRAAIKELRAAQRDLAIAQAQTERRLSAFLASMEKGRNGRSRT